MALPIDARPSQPMQDFSAQAASFDAMTPHASGADYSPSRSINIFSGPRARVGAVLLGAAATFSGLGGVGGVSGQDATETPRTQDPRATVKPAETGTPEPGESAKPTLIPSSEPLPSVTPDPITGLLPCPSPTPEPTETPLPDRTIDPGIGRIGGEVLFAQGMNSDGSIVKLTIFAQEEPSIAPSEDPETALLDNPNCEPETTPDTSIDVILKGTHEKINLEVYEEIAKNAAPHISNFLVENGINPDSTAEIELNDYVIQFNQIKKNYSFEASGKTLANNIVYSVANAQYALEIGDQEAAAAFMEIAVADYRVGITFLKTNELENTFNRNVFHKAIKKVFNQYYKKGIIK